MTANEPIKLRHSRIRESQTGQFPFTRKIKWYELSFEIETQEQYREVIGELTEALHWLEKHDKYAHCEPEVDTEESHDETRN